MLDFQQKRKIRSMAYSRVVIGILLLVVLFMAHSTWTVYKKKMASEEMKNISLQNVEDLRQRNKDLESKISRLDTTPGIEEEIRLKFNVVKGDENMVVIVEDEREETSATGTTTSFWQKIKNLFANE
ncbi:MAG: hypothetical protein QG579_144 [Patescibacteria group bacterium]|nr:hypothetical protein [Patescibacteria group bacterium]